MTSTISLSGLIERIEAAEGPDRELDQDIHELVKLGLTETTDKAYNWCERYTASLDAARTLIDPADEWELSTIYNIARATVGLNRDHQTSWPGYGEHKGGNPTLALLSAALRARAQSQGSSL